MLKNILLVSVTGIGLCLQATQSLATPFFRCTSGYTFKLNSTQTAAHCRKRGKISVKPIVCPQVTFMGMTIGTFPYASSGKDSCRGQAKVGGMTQTTDHPPLNCLPNYSYEKNYQGIEDKCIRGGWTYEAPTYEINSTP
jgi:hypothetical protein